MKIIFEGKERQILMPKQPMPKKLQVWERVRNGELFTVYDVKIESNETLGVYFEDQRGERHYTGCAWLNGKDYKFVGKLF